MGNSTISLQSIVDDAASMGDTAPALATGGVSDGPALSMANDVMAAMLLGGPDGQPFAWKWNRATFDKVRFFTNSWQQDYFLPGISNVAWIEMAWAVNFQQTSNPKQKIKMEVRRDLAVTADQTGYPSKICWIYNDQAQTGTWGQTALASVGGLTNPGPSAVYSDPSTATQAVNNPITIIKDPNGNLWVVTTYGTCGTVQPNWPASPQYPTFSSPNTVATTVTDGTVVWTAVDPKGQGMRLAPIPPQTGIEWLIEPQCQLRAPTFANLQQLLDPIPDDFATYFKQGFFAQCYRRSADPKVRAKFPDEWRLFMDALRKAIIAGQRELDDVGFYPGSSIMDSGISTVYLGPAYPWPPFGG